MEFVLDLIPLVEHLIEERGGEPIALGLGNSFGGLVTAYAAALRPKLFRKVAMLDPVIRPPAHMFEEMLASMPVPDPEALRGRGNPMAVLARKRQQVWPSREIARDVWKDKEMFQDWNPRALQLYVEEGMRDRPDGQVELKCKGEVEASVFEASGMLDLFEVAHQLEAPTLILRAGRGYFPMAVYEELAARMHAGRALELDIDHLMPMHDPPELMEAIFDFVRE
jgi:pimeloyl-ACP methyl ester carboxylesterase